MNRDDSIAATTHTYLRDIYAQQLFQEDTNGYRSWKHLTREDRDIYRQLALALIKEQRL